MKKLILLIGIIGLSYSTNAQFIGELITFETPDSLSLIENWPGNCFQIGIPTKIFFNSAWSAPNALVTNLNTPYPPNNNSAFTIKIYDPSWNWGTDPGVTVSFKHKYDTDSLYDGGYIMISKDGGNSWTNIINAVTSVFYYDPENQANPIIANGNTAYTGKSRMNNSTEYGWRTDEMQLCFLFEKSYLRFIFSSDSIQTNKEGWMIDNIRIQQEICEGINKIRSNTLIDIAPNPASDQLTILQIKSGSRKTISIIDPTGRVYFYDENFSGNKIDIQNLHDGIYFLQYSNGISSCLKKFIVAKK